jgi:predicted ATPase
VKIASIKLQNFKRFGEITIAVKNELTQDIANQFLVLGDNGTGKTTVLQAVALCLSLASGTTRNIESFDWKGWVPGRYEKRGQPVVELEVHFSPEEIEATREAARRWSLMPKDFDTTPYVEPGNSQVVRLRLEGHKCSARNAKEFYQFKGRRYAAQLLRTDPSARDLFDHLPGIFWFDQLRNLASPPPDAELGKNPEGSGSVTFAVGVTRLREHLNRWQLNRLAAKGTRARDFLTDLENLYKRIFPNHSFAGPEPMYSNGVPTPADYYFLLSDGEHTYDIEEMSAGEQAIFPVLYEFVRQQIRNSVVLIDEIDLNLHPPLAQALLAALPCMGQGNQFIFTTHSDTISQLVSPEQIYRLPGGKLCL